jgi:large subunit ribosomal protein L18
MDRLSSKVHNSSRRKARVRTRTRGTKNRPRLSVFISNHNVSAQIIDDSAHVTLASARTQSQKTTGTMTVRAESVGREIAKKAKSQKIKQVVFDRGPKLYHGRIKALAEAARKEGLEF